MNASVVAIRNHARHVFPLRYVHARNRQSIAGTVSQPWPVSAPVTLRRRTT